MISMKQFRNELLSNKLYGFQLHQRGGNSPFSRYDIYQCNAASKACDRLAKRLDSTCLSTQINVSGSIVTLTLGLLSDLIYTKITPMCINIDGALSTLALLLCSAGVGKDENAILSGRCAPGRTGGEDADIPDRRGRTGHTHVGQSLVRVLSFGGHGRLHEDGDVGSRYCDGSETDNPVRAQGITDGSMSDSIKPFTSAECGRRFTLTAPCYPIIQILDGAFRPAELFPNVSSAGKHLSPVREVPSEKWEGGASAPPETYPEAI